MIPPQSCRRLGILIENNRGSRIAQRIRFRLVQAGHYNGQIDRISDPKNLPRERYFGECARPFES